MSFFDDENNFDDMVNQLFGGAQGRRRTTRRTAQSEEEGRTIDFTETDDSIYVIFELSGYDEDDVSVRVEGKTLEVSAKKKVLDDVKEYLAAKLSAGIIYQKALPENAISKDFDYSIKNGVLEVKLRRKK
jgi:HSP20 family molecular chaperone IbpA